jgi:hypothetical protein
MAIQYVVATGAIPLTLNVARTCIEIPTGSTFGFDVTGLEVTLDSTVAGSCVVEWGTFTTTGTGTTVTAATYSKNAGTAILGTVKVNDTAEPAGFAAAGLPSWVLAIPGAQYSILLPYAREMYQPPSTNRCIRLTCTQSCSARLNLFIEQ